MDLNIIDFEKKLEKDFYNLNIEWLKKIFIVEKYDEEILSNSKKYIIDKGGEIFFAKTKDEIIGTVALMPTSEKDIFELSKMAVKPNYRNKGVGKQLLKKCVKLNPFHQGAQFMLSEAQEAHSSKIDSRIDKNVKPELPQRIRPENPVVSVIVPNWNGMRFVSMCLDSLDQLYFENFEVIVVDNGSTDGSRELIEEKYPWARLLKLPHNKGFAIACNEGIKNSNAKYIVLLNNDIEVAPDWLTELYEGMERHPECGMGTTKMMFLDNRDVFYNTGDLFHAWSSGGGRGQGEKDIGQYDLENYVFGACAGAGIYRKELFNQIGLFDEDFFIFAEDVDLNMRSQLQRFQAVYLPKSKVYHIGTATVGLYSDRYVYLCKRNDILVFIKNYSLKMYFKYLSSIWKHQFADIKYFTYRGQGRVLFKSKWGALKLLPKMLFRRFQIQRTRIASDCEIQKHIIID